jgi:hypothetical protein
MLVLRKPLTWLYERAAAIEAFLLGGDGMSRAGRDRWARARTLGDVGELTAHWLEGRIDSQPNYRVRCDVDEADAPGLTGTLVALNRAGFVTSGSQAGHDGEGYDGAHWQQYAAVVGFATPEIVGWLQDTVVAPVAADGSRADTGLCLTRCARATFLRDVDTVTFRDGVPVTDFGNRYSARDLRDDWAGYGVCHPDAVAELVAAEQVVVRDTEFGRNDRLWPALRAAADQRAVAEGVHLDRGALVSGGAVTSDMDSTGADRIDDNDYNDDGT